MSGASVPPWPWSVDLRNHSVNFGDASDKNVRHLKPWKEHQLVVLFFYQVFLKPNILCVYIYICMDYPHFIYKIYRPSAEHGVLPSARLQEMDMLWSGSLQVPFLRIWCWNYVVFYHSKSAVLFGGSHVFSQVKLLKTCT